ncbi:MAG: amino acid adenylation domain-containing protein [Cyanobacteria bacterium P01_A01_bin.105]
MTTVSDIYELSPTQQGMLFHTLYAPTSGIYVEQRHCLLEGTLNTAAFRQAWQQVVNRHGVLRSEFHWQESDQPLQVVYDTVDLPWVAENWSVFDAAQQQEKLLDFLLQDRRYGFQLDQAPLMRCALFKLATDQHRFVWTYHHLLMDGWCNGVLIKEVLTIYQAICQGAAWQLPQPKPYSDYIIWLQQQDSQPSEGYWRQVLAGFTAPTPLQIIHTTPDQQQVSSAQADQQQQYQEQHSWLSAHLSSDLQGFAQQSCLTLNTLFQGAWAVILSRYSGLTDVLFGITVAGRSPDLSGVESMVGLFINTVPLRTQLPHDAMLLPWLQRLQTEQRSRDTHGYTALTDLQDWSEVPNGTPLFDSLLVFENYPLSIESATRNLADGLVLKDGQGYERTNYPLTLVVIPGESIQLSLRYDASQISDAAAHRLLCHLEVVLGSFVVNPQQQLGQLPLLTQAEQQQLYRMGQGPSIEPSGRCVHELFEAQVAQTPAAIALTFATASAAESLTYQQLNQHANQLAHYLRQQGVGAGVGVGIYLARSHALVITLLAILKTGAAYIPLDPAYPVERLNYIVADAQMGYLITTAAVQALAFDGATIYLEQVAGPVQQQSIHNLTPRSVPDSIAYTIYTSGSTGKPKGVPIRHHSLTNFLAAMTQAPGITAADTVLAVTTLAFDIAALEIFLPLVSGAQLMITPRELTQDGPALAQLISRHTISLMQATPATWRLLLDSGWSPASGLKSGFKILCGGDALPLDLARQLLSCGQALWNLYGPTETTIWSGALQITPEILASGQVPIGRPIANTQFYVLDEQQRQTPLGIPGELYIGGSGLSPGYLNRPDLTTARFIPNMMGHHGHLYRTGDRVCYREDGTLEYLGRLDNQIKLRGFRIELGEIEAILAQHPALRQVVVALRGTDNPQLVAYLVVHQETEQAIDPAIHSLNGDTLADTLRQWLSQRLPVYMLPAAYVLLSSLPLTPNGKVDRRALPDPEQTARPLALPQTPEEQLIAGIWAAVLGRETVGLNDHFFELGGHSLLATRVITQVDDALAVDVPLRALFEHPILADFVAVVSATRGEQPSLEITIPAAKAHVLSYPQQRQWLMAQLAPESTAYTIPIAVRLEGKLSFDGLSQSLSQVVNRHEILRTGYPKGADGQPVPAVLPAPEAVEIRRVDLSTLGRREQHAAVTQQIKQQSCQGFDLSQGPLWRATLLRLDGQTHILLLALHHIIADGWSLGVLLKELTTGYRAHQSGQPVAIALPPLTLQYTDYAIWQKSLNFDRSLAYWRQQLADVPPLLELPTDYPRSSASTQVAGNYEFRLSKQQTKALQQFSQRHSSTLFMTLLAAFKVLLYRYSGAREIVVGTPIANRQQAKLDHLIGLFVNTLALRSDLSGNPRFTELLTQVRSTSLAAYDHQALPFEQLLEALELPRSQSHSPLFQVMFALQNMPMAAVAVDNLRWMPLPTETSTAKFDLTLEMRETDSGLVGVFEYRRDLFSADTMHRMAGHFRTLLKALPENGQLRLSDLPMLLRQDKQQLEAWRQSPTREGESVSSTCIHQRFEAQAGRTPQTIALVHHQTQITYRELNQRANQLAHYLRQRGVTVGKRVGLWAERSPQVIVAMLAILKAGGAYVPLEPGYPQERLDWMVKDTGIALVLSLTESVELSVEVVALGAIASALSQYPTTNLPSTTTPDSLAYILYTSGSTGQPKGVCTPHRGVTRLVTQPNYVTLDEKERLLQAAPLSFDASTFEIWGALLNGGQLVLLPTQMPSLAELGAAIRTHQVTTLWLTAGLFNLMVDAQLEDLKSVRQLLAGGDVLSPHHLQKALAALKDIRIINGYGPTEATTFTCCHTINLTDLVDSVPIGSPINETQIYVLDADLQQVPPGLPGELYVGGAGLAQGYLNRPELTAERFIPNPFYDIRQVGSDPLYLYRTGDRVRHRSDGTLEYLGRLDQQVKIRGFRIEPGEIEIALTHHPEIQQAVVVVDGNTAAQKRLVAYLQSEAGLVVEAASLRQFLLTRLPDYMMPAKFIWLDAMPLTANGKVDRGALPSPQWNNDDTAVPTTDIEQQLTTAWSEVLRLESVGIYDNFFDLGGDSILALQIVSRVAQLGLTLTPRQLFQHQTVAELATVVELSRDDLISQVPATGNLPLTPIQQWFFAQELANPNHFNQSVYLELPVATNWHVLSQAVAAVYQSHDGLRLRFTPTPEGWQQRYAEVEVAQASTLLQQYDLAHLSAAEQDAEITRLSQQLHASLNLQTGPMLGLAGFKLGSSARLLIVAHHLVVDGVSWRILLGDLQQAYQRGLAGNQITSLPRTHSYQQWATELLQRVGAPDIEADVDHWQAVAQQHTALPTDFSSDNSPNTVAASATVMAVLSVKETQRVLQTVVSTYHVQITAVLATALVQSLLAWTQQSNIVIDLENYGRFSETLDLSRTVGWFTGLYPVSFSLEADAPLSQQLQQISEQLQAVPNNGLSYGLLRYGKSRNALDTAPSIGFNYLGQVDAMAPFKRLPSPAANQAGDNQRRHLIDINCWVEAGQFQMAWTYSTAAYAKATIETLAQGVVEKLAAIATQAETENYTPDDFGLAQLDQSALDTVLAQVSFAGQEVSG